MFTVFILILNSKNFPCIFAADLLICRRLSEIDKAPIELIIYGIALVSIERFIATFYYKNYENYKNYWISAAAVVITWIYPLIHLFYVFNDPKIESTVVPYCSSLTSNSIDFLAMVSVKTPICSLCTLLNLITLWLAKRNKKNEPNNGYEYISGRYQLNESIKFTQMITVSNGICHLLVLINVLSLFTIANTKFENYITFAVAKVSLIFA
uniref:Uncharacterized protein n=1 Tax=Panagrolaimus davidi TaxID=227884 RepID=A0A914R4V1_9BILA